MASGFGFYLLPLLLSATSLAQNAEAPRPRARDLGVEIGVLPTGPLNAITDVARVKVGQTTIVRGDDIRTGVTAILPHGRNLFQEKVPGAVFLGNAFGKLAGSTQVRPLLRLFPKARKMSYNSDRRVGVCRLPLETRVPASLGGRYSRPAGRYSDALRQSENPRIRRK